MRGLLPAPLALLFFGQQVSLMRRSVLRGTHPGVPGVQATSHDATTQRPAVPRDRRVDQIKAMSLLPRNRAFLIRFDGARIADHGGSRICGNMAFHANTPSAGKVVNRSGECQAVEESFDVRFWL
jgi:hypothetical protein